MSLEKPSLEFAVNLYKTNFTPLKQQNLERSEKCPHRVVKCYIETDLKLKLE